MTDIKRRVLLSGMTAAAATAAFGSIVAAPMAAFADSPESPEVTFSRLSAVLTGIDQNVLAPNVDPLRVNHEIFTKSNEKNADTLRQMLQRFAAAEKDPDKEKTAVATIMKQPSPGDELGEKMRFLGRSIILAWYLGAWYAPEDLRLHFYDPAKKNYYSYRRYSKSILIPHTLLPPSVYTGSMVWRVMQAHPMGYSNLQFGYWAKNPPDFVDFVTPGERSK